MIRIVPVAFLASLAASAFAQDAALKLKTDRVVIFKDGYGLFVKSGKARADEKGRVYTEEVPRALLGTVWGSSADGKPISLRAELVESTKKSAETHPATSMLELLRANLGGTITIDLEKQSVGGTLKQLIEPGAGAKEAEESVVSIVPETVDPAMDPYSPGYSSSRRFYGYSPPPVPTPAPPTGEAFIVLSESGGASHVIAVRDIKSFTGRDVKTDAPAAGAEAKRTKRLTFEFGAASANKDVDVNILYLQEGIQWIPSYRVSGDLKTSATMALQGELVNEAEDLDGAAVDLVVGVPNFRFNDRVSPLSLDRELRRTLTSISQTGGGGSMAQMMSNSQMAYAGAPTGSATTSATNSFFDPSMETQQGQDLFFYSSKDVSLKRGGRMTLPLWSSDLAVSHCYRFSVQAGKAAREEMDASNQNRWNPQPSSGRTSPLDINKNEVWHIIEAKNETKLPWTTGAALVLQDGLPISQDMLAYTPVGATGSLPLTIAVDVRGEFRDEETARQQNAFNRNGTNYDLIKKRGTVTVTNYRKEAAKVQVIVSAGGKAVGASDDGKIVLNDFRALDWPYGTDLGMNQHSDVKWDFMLEPGAKKDVTYDVEFYGR
ncbi:hypothetical protein BH09SUM1_BH09SUM1_25700 [soil metagenome]